MSFELLESDRANRSVEGAVGDRNGSVSRGCSVPDPELVERAARRSFTVKYKLEILRQVDACSDYGEVGALLRREGLYSSLLSKWRAQRDAGALEGLSARRRGPKGRSVEQIEVEELRRALKRTEVDLANARKVIEVQGKVSALLEGLLATSADEKTDRQSTR